MRHFLVKYGFSRDEVIQIDHTEVEKAIYAHLKGITVAFKNGSVSGDRIIAIVPDFNSELGWGLDHKLDSYDYGDLDRVGLREKYQSFLSEIKEKVQYLMQTGQTNLIGKNAKIPELERPITETRAGKSKSMKELIEKRV